MNYFKLAILCLCMTGLAKACINISTYDNYIRISPSFYNDLNEIEQLIAVLKKAS